MNDEQHRDHETQAEVISASDTPPPVNIDDASEVPEEGETEPAVLPLAAEDTGGENMPPELAAPPRPRSAYWIGGALAASLLIGVIAYRLDLLPVSSPSESTVSPTPAQTAVQPMTAPLPPARSAGSAATDAQQVAVKMALPAVAETTPGAATAAFTVGSAEEPQAAQGVPAAATDYSQQWGVVVARFMNPFAYLQVASQVMSSVAQAWGFEAPPAGK